MRAVRQALRRLKRLMQLKRVATGASSSLRQPPAMTRAMMIGIDLNRIDMPDKFTLKENERNPSNEK